MTKPKFVALVVFLAACGDSGGASDAGGGTAGSVQGGAGSMQGGEGAGAGTSAGGAGSGATGNAAGQNNGGTQGAGASGSAGTGNQGGAGSSGGGSAGTSGGDVEAACQAVAKAQCAKMNECSPAAWTEQFGSNKACEARTSAACVAAHGLPGVKMSAASLNDCAGIYPKTTCANLGRRKIAAACNLPGALTDGAICAHGWQCQSTRCAISQGKSCGFCQARSATGGDCQIDDDCLSDRLCLKGSICTPYANEGDSCISSECGPELSCVGFSLKECQTAPKGGEPCDPNGLSAGSCSVQSKSFCDSGTCHEQATVTGGMPCVEGETVCTASLCSNKKCRPYKIDGSSCGDASECQPPAVCAGGKCALVNTACK